jgi:NAD(P)-dependent dehydrogenase (short-subunit alcohol dehydrogenase family)
MTAMDNAQARNAAAPFLWKDQVAVVTGAGGAMGREVVRALLERGSTVVGFDRPEALAALDTTGAGSFTGMDVNVADVDAVTAAFAKVEANVGLPSMLVNFAGVSSGTESFLDTTQEEWDRIIGINLAGSFWCCREALRRMIPLGRGSIVNISSINGLMARRHYHTHIYAVSKAGVVGLTKTLAAEAAEHGVRVNCIAPGMHVSTMQNQMMGTSEGANTFIDIATRATPLGRAGLGPDMAGPVLFLLGDESAYITGHVLVSDGGRSMWYE